MPEDTFEAVSIEAWSEWLEANHARKDGVWLVTFKKGSGMPTLDYEDTVTEALRFGWVDSKVGKVDERRSKLWFAPRRPKTGWSRPNKERIARLEASGRMKPTGAAKVAAARADGSWSLLDDVENLVVPPDLAQALAALPGARANWDAFPRSVQRGVLEWILNAKRPETRAKRIAETSSLAAENKRANQWPRAVTSSAGGTPI